MVLICSKLKKSIARTAKYVQAKAFDISTLEKTKRGVGFLFSFKPSTDAMNHSMNPMNLRKLLEDGQALSQGSIASVVSMKDGKIDTFWAAHRALAAFYEADIARLEAGGTQPSPPSLSFGSQKIGRHYL